MKLTSHTLSDRLQKFKILPNNSLIIVNYCIFEHFDEGGGYFGGHPSQTHCPIDIQILLFRK